MWTAPPLTSGLLVLSAFFVAAFFVRFLLAALLVTLLATKVGLITGLLASTWIASGLFVRTALAALLAGTHAGATLFHSLIALSIVCHICSSPLLVN